MHVTVRRSVDQFYVDTSGASLVEYSVALIVVTLVGMLLFAMGGDIAAIIDISAGAF